MRKSLHSSPSRIVLDTIASFVFFSILTAFVEATYTFGLLGTDIPPEIAYVLFLLSPFLLLLFPKLVDSRGFMRVTGSLGFLCWAVSLPLDTRWRLVATGAGCGLFLLFLAARIRQVQRGPAELALGLGAGVLVSVLVRAARSGSLLLADGSTLVICLALAFLAVVLLLFSGREAGAEPEAERSRHGSLRSLGLSLGLFSALALLYFGFTSPVVLARWGEVSYLTVLAVEGAALVGFLAAWLCLPGFRAPSGALFVGNFLFVAALALAVRFQQPGFSAASVYPLYAAAPRALGKAAFWAMLVLHPVLYADFALLARALNAEQPSPRGYVRGFAMSSLFLLLVIFSQIFTTVYDYIPVIGPLFRNGFWLVTSIPGVVVALSILLLRRRGSLDASSPRAAWALGVVVLAAGAVLLAGLTSVKPVPPAAGADRKAMRILTYNLQEGYGKTGEKSYVQQLRAIRAVEADIVGIEETDTARLAGGNSDLVRFLADELGMYSWYGPNPASGTFGVALLSRFPIQDARTFFMPSRGEQTAAIDARIIAKGKTFHVLVTHLDNDGALPQQRLVVESAARGTEGAAIAIAMGDFNFSPSTEQYRVTTAALEDAWAQCAVRQVDPGAPDPADRIDHIFLSKNTRVTRARYLPEGPSDHPAMFAEIAW
jgi:endonuclease/exonuclease/phosphatase family metal-dependent hydrolase